MPLNCVTMRLKGLFIIECQGKTLKKQNPNAKSLWAPLGLVGNPTSQGHNLVILSPFGTYNIFLGRSPLVLKDLWAHFDGYGSSAHFHLFFPQIWEIKFNFYLKSSGTSRVVVG